MLSDYYERLKFSFPPGNLFSSNFPAGLAFLFLQRIYLFRKIFSYRKIRKKKIVIRFIILTYFSKNLNCVYYSFLTILHRIFSCARNAFSRKIFGKGFAKKEKREKAIEIDRGGGKKIG